MTPEAPQVTPVCSQDYKPLVNRPHGQSVPVSAHACSSTGSEPTGHSAPCLSRPWRPVRRIIDVPVLLIPTVGRGARTHFLWFWSIDYTWNYLWIHLKWHEWASCDLLQVEMSRVVLVKHIENPGPSDRDVMLIKLYHLELLLSRNKDKIGYPSRVCPAHTLRCCLLSL